MFYPIVLRVKTDPHCRTDAEPAVIDIAAGAVDGADAANIRGTKFGQFLFTADSLADVYEYDQRGFGYDSHEKALRLALDIVSNWR